MPIQQSDIEKVAQLAHLELGEEELKTFGSQIAEIVNYVEQLNELDRRFEEYQRDPDKVVTWEEVKARVLSTRE